MKATKAAAAMLAVSTMFVPPATADYPEATGHPCAFATTSDPTGILFQDPELQVGVMTAGPLVIGDFVNDASPGPSHLTPVDGKLHCWVQFDSRVPSHFPLRLAHCDFEGSGVIAGACQIEYYLGDYVVFLCGMLEAHDAIIDFGCTRAFISGPSVVAF